LCLDVEQQVALVSSKRIPDAVCTGVQFYGSPGRKLVAVATYDSAKIKVLKL